MTRRFAIASSIERRRALAAWAVAAGGDWSLNKDAHIHRMRLQRGKCYLCIKKFEPGRGREPKSRTRDHVFPRSGGGKTGANILEAHKDCNEAKDDRWPFPCEVIYLATIYAAPINRQMRVALRLARAASAARHARVEALLAS